MTVIKCDWFFFFVLGVFFFSWWKASCICVWWSNGMSSDASHLVNLVFLFEAFFGLDTKSELLGVFSSKNKCCFRGISRLFFLTATMFPNKNEDSAGRCANTCKVYKLHVFWNLSFLGQFFIHDNWFIHMTYTITCILIICMYVGILRTRSFDRALLRYHRGPGFDMALFLFNSISCFQNYDGLLCQ